MDKLYKNITMKMPHIIRTTRAKYNLFLKSSYCQNKHPVTEAVIKSKLQEKFPQAKFISVEDTSGGCGAMFNISVELNEFKGLSVTKQHKLVYDSLKDQIKNIHGLHLETRIPK